MGKRRKKKKVPNNAEEGPAVPHTFVMHRGIVGKSVMTLENDLRLVMEPYTARNLKVRKNNVLKDFVHVAGPLGVTHFLILSKTEVGTYLRIARLPRGPTLTFKVNEYSLAKDVISLVKRPKTVGSQFKNPPLLVLNGFNTETLSMKLMTTTFQNLFPSINIQKVNLSDIRRCVLMDYNQDTKQIQFRHYDIQVVPVGMSRGVKKIIQTKLPNMSKLDDISDFVLGAGCGYGSESEGEEPPDSNVTLPQNLPGRGNMKAQKSAIRLTEMGPRLVIQLIKIEDGLCGGEVLFHEFITKTQAEIRAAKEKREKKRKLKEMRQKVQEENVKRKAKEKELNRERSIAGQKKKKMTEEEGVESPASEEENIEEEEDDEYWYRQEVGAEPDKDLILTNKRGSKRKAKEQLDLQVDKKKHKKDDKLKTDKLKVKKTKADRKESFGKKSKLKNTSQKSKKTFGKKKPLGKRNFKKRL